MTDQPRAYHVTSACDPISEVLFSRSPIKRLWNFAGPRLSVQLDTNKLDNLSPPLSFVDK